MKLRAIRENHLYSKAYSRGKKYVARNVIVYVLPDYAAARLERENPQKKRYNRVGLTVTKKLGSAVIRNRAKRIMREGYRQVFEKNPVKVGFLVVIVARGGIVRAKSTDIASDISIAFKNLGMIKGKN